MSSTLLTNQRVAARSNGPLKRLRAGKGLWWISPPGVSLLVIPLSLLLATQLSDQDYRLFYQTPRALTDNQAFLFLLAAGVMAVGAIVPMVIDSRPWSLQWPALNADQVQVLRRGTTVAFWLTSLGYAAFGALGVKRGANFSLLYGTLTSQNDYTGQLKQIFAPVAGVTSLTQVGIAYVVLASLLLCHERSKKTTRRLITVLFLGLLRSYFLTERLAILELLVPICAIGATRLRQRSRARFLMPAVPAIALPLLVVVFGLFEYSRSWVYFRSRTTLSFPAFVIRRLAGYYATSYNNGALQLQYGHVAGQLPYASIQGLWTSPGPAQLNLYTKLTGINGPDILNNVLTQHGNPEFNNPGGLATPLFDFGTLGGMIFFLIAGVLIGMAYRGFRTGDPIGLLVYPVLFTGLLELPRYVYWTQGRVVPAYLTLFIIAFRMRQTRYHTGSARAL